MNEKVYVSVIDKSKDWEDAFLIYYNQVDTRKKLEEEVYKRYGTSKFVEITIKK